MRHIDTVRSKQSNLTGVKQARQPANEASLVREQPVNHLQRQVATE